MKTQTLAHALMHLPKRLQRCCSVEKANKKRNCCAVCRKPVDGGDGASTSAGPSSRSSGASTSQQWGRPPVLRLRPPRGGGFCYSSGLDFVGFGPELAFRLHRMRARHTNYLTQVSCFLPPPSVFQRPHHCRCLKLPAASSESAGEPS
jgi:hypothetical protein